MNRIYRLVFNRALRVWQVASELVSGPQAGGKCGGASSTAVLRPVSFALWLALGWVTVMPAHAQQGRIIADPRAPRDERPTVLETPNGLPQVNIRTPSRDGVSRNVYSQFDVGQSGVILNNSRTDTQTELAGWIGGNPWLATGPARVILNEVNSSDPSRLHGYVEVAGQRAEVVIANPAGIQVDGGGFINASRVTLTTGTPVMKGGALDGYRVERGGIVVEGGGLDARQADYTDLIARSLQVNAGIWAEHLQASLGSNTVRADHGEVAPLAGGTGAPPTFALDVGALGGMYANKIWLVGNEHGVGVRNAGQIGAQAGDLVVTFDGRLENTGSMQARHDVRVAAAGGMANSGTLSAEQALVLDAGGALDNSGGTLSAQHLEIDASALRNHDGSIVQTGGHGLSLTAATLANRDGGRIGISAPAPQDGEPDATPPENPVADAGDDAPGSDESGSDEPNSDGTPVAEGPGTDATPEAAPGFLRIAGRIDNDGGAIHAGGGIDLRVDSGLDNTDGHLGVDHLALAGGALDNAGGQLLVAGDIDLALERVVNDGGHLEAGGVLDLEVGQLANRGGTLVQRGQQASALRVEGSFDNTDGVVFTAASAFELHSSELLNARGRIEHGGDAGMQLRTGQLTGQEGVIATAGSLVLEAGEVDHRDATLSAAGLRLDATGFDNDGGLVASRGELSIHTGALGNAAGTIQQSGEGGLDIHADTLDGHGGILASDGALQLHARSADLRDGTTQAQAIVLDTGELVNAGGTMIALGDAALEITASERMDNSGGHIQGNGALQLDAGILHNRDGLIAASGPGDSRIHVGGLLDNTRGVLATGATTDLRAGELVNRGGAVQAAGPLGIVVGGPLDNSGSGFLGASGGLHLEAPAVLNTGGSIVNANSGELVILTEVLEGAYGTVTSAGGLVLDGETVNLYSGSVVAEQISIDAGSLTTAYGTLNAFGSEVLRLNVRGALDNTHGSIAGNGALDVAAQSLFNHGGNITAAGGGASRVTIGGIFDNTGGTLAVAGQGYVSAGGLDNRGGTLSASGSLEVDVSGRLDNGDGLIASGGSMSLSANVLVNTDGTIRHAGTGRLSLRANALELAYGTILSNGSLWLDGADIDLTGATTQAWNIAIHAATLTTAGGALSATGKGPLVLKASDWIDNTGGRIESNGTLQLDTAELHNAGGTVRAIGSGASTITVSGTLDSTGGVLETGGDTVLQAAELRNAGGVVRTGGSGALYLDVAGGIDNSAGGYIGAGGDLDLSAQVLDNTRGGIGHAGDGTLTINVDTLDGAGGTIASNGTVLLSADDVNLRDGSTSASRVVIDADTLVTAGGMLSASGNDPLAITARTMLDNAGGHIAGNGAFHIQAPVLDNRGGTITAAGTQSSQLDAATALDNTGGTIIAAGDTVVHAGELSNAGGQLQAAGQGRLQVTADGLLDNTAGIIAAGGDMDLAAQRLDNTAGTLHHAGGGQLDITVPVFDGQGGTIASNGTLTLVGDQIDLENGTTIAHAISVDATGLTTAGGQMQAAGPGVLSLAVGGALDNAGGTIAGNGSLAVTAGTLDNSSGYLGAAGTGTSLVDVAGQLDNAAGTIETGTDLALSTAHLDNTAGTIRSAGGDLHIDAGVLDGAGGTLSGQGTLHLQGTHTNLGGGTTVADRIILDTGTLITAGGTLASTGIQVMDLTAHAGLDNSGGRIASGGGLDITAGAVDNAGGQIDARGALALGATSLDNRNGQVLDDQGAGLTVSVSGALDNSGGGVIGGSGNARVQAGSLDNSGGTLAARDALEVTSQGALHNQDGLLQGQAGISVQAGGLFDNRAGLLDTAGVTTVVAGAIDNAGGQILAGSQDAADGGTPTLVVTASGHLANSGGTIGSRAGDVQVGAGSLDNGSDGVLAAPRDLLLDVGTLDNDGTVYAARDLHYTSAAGMLDNRGRFGAGENLWIQLASIRNAMDARIQARNVHLVTGLLDLAGGQIDADYLQLNLGLLSGSGRLFGAQMVDVDIAGDFTYGAGQVLETGGVLDLNVGGILTNAGAIQSTTDLLLTAGGLVNHGTINASNAGGTGLLSIHAGSVDNRSGARLEGDAVLIDAGAVANTGDIIGNEISIEAGSLTNGRHLGTADAAVAYGEGFIGAADFLGLRVGSLSNLDGELFSAGDMDIVGHDGIAPAGSVVNLSGRILAGGQLYVGAGTVDNRRRVIEYINRELSPAEQADGRLQVDPADLVYYDAAYQSEYAKHCSEDFDCRMSLSSYVETLTPLNEVAITRTSAAAQLLAGASMILEVNTLYNRASVIAAGGGILINGSGAGEDAPGVFNESFAAMQDWEVNATYGVGFRYCAGTLHDCAANNSYQTAGYAGYYGPRQVQFPYAPEEGRATIIAGGGVNISTGGDVSNTVVVAPGEPGAMDTAGVDQAPGQVMLSGPGQLPGQGGGAPVSGGPDAVEAGTVGGVARPRGASTARLRRDGLDPLQAAWINAGGGPHAVQNGGTPAVDGPGRAQTIGTPEQPLPGLVPPDNAMYAREPGAGAAFLVSTSPRFARGEAGGSDYLLGRLDVPGDTHKRLGDGYYERRLVQDQVQELTGRRNLAGTADDGDGLAQYTALMDGAAAVADRLGLSLGAPLTSTQVAALDQDIVWLVEQDVAGERVLVPVVYLSRSTGERLASTGGLIAGGESLDVTAGGAVRNDGTLQGGQSTWLSADTLINDGVVRGARVTVDATGDVFNRRQLTGQTVVVTAGGDYVQGASGRLHASDDARIQAEGDLVLERTGVSAGRNVTLIAGQDLGVSASRVQAGGDLALVAGGDLDLAQRSTVTADGSMALHANRDLSVRQSTVAAGQDLTAYAGRDLSVQSQVGQTTGQLRISVEDKTRVSTVTRTQALDVQALTAGGNLALGAGHDVNLVAAELNAGGALTVSAGHDLNTTTLTTADSSHTLETRKRFRQTTTTLDETVHGTTFNAGGDIGLVAGRDVNLAAATAISDQGGIALAAGRDVNLTAAQEQHGYTQTTVKKKKSLLSSKTTTTRESYDDGYAIGTTLSGETVAIKADNAVTIQGSDVVSSHGTTISGAQGVEIVNAYDTSTTAYASSKKKSGVFGNGGPSFTIGSKKSEVKSQSNGSSVRGSVVGSLYGDTTIVSSEGAVHVQGSAISSPEGDVTLLGRAVNIEEGHDTSTYKELTRTKQSGVTVGASAPVVDAALSAYDSAKTAGRSKDNRVNALAAANTAYDTYQAAGAVAGAASGGGQSVNVSITYGKQQSKSELTATSDGVVGSTVNAGGQLNVVATGGGMDSDVRISGSDVYGGTGTLLYADDAIDIQAAQSTYKQKTENNSSGWNAGVAVSGGSSGWAAGITAGGNVGKGHSDGQTIANVNAHVGSDGTTTLISGGTTTIRGGQVSGDRVEVDAANLVIESLQDTETYDSKQMNASAQVTAGYGVSVSASYNQSNIQSDYASVSEQSGILAGDGGYAVKVRGSTELIGGIVTSTSEAEATGRNSFSTGTLAIADIQNRADYEGSSFGLSGSMGVNGKGEQGQHQMAQGAPDGKAGGTSASKSIGFGIDDAHQSSTTHSGINTANITITDAAGQATTGRTIDQIKADVATTTSTDTVAKDSGALSNRFDADAVQRELDLQVQVTQAFDRNRQEAKAELYAHAQAKLDQAREIRMANGGVDTEESRRLDEEAAGIKKNAMWLDVVAMGIYAGPDASNLLTGEAMTQIDLVRRTATAQSKIVVQRCEANGQNCTNWEVDISDVAVGGDGSIHVFNNGIFNKEEYALATGAKQNSNEASAQGVYYILNPYTGNPVAEILYAGYDKLNDLLGGVLPLTSAEKANQVIIDMAGQQGGVVNSVNHSRGSMTWTNAMHDLDRQDRMGLPLGVILYNGAAANAQEAATLVDKIGDDRGEIYQSTHPTDIVGRWIGGNPATSQKNDGSFPDSHSSYTAELPPEGTYIQVGDDPGSRVNLREITDKNWGQGKYSVPAYVAPKKKEVSKLKEKGGE